MRLATQPRLSVLQVALAVGFGSGEAFARAFRQRFAASPSAWRRLRKIDQVQRNFDQAAYGAVWDDEDSSTSRAEHRMNVTLIERAPTPIAYFRYTGPLGAPVEKFWMQQVAPWLAENNLLGRVRYGISHDDPSITDAAKCRYDACVELEPEAIVSGQPLRATLPGGRYACMHFECTSGQIDAAWRSLLRDWLPDSGLQLDARPCLEHYPRDAKFDAATGVFDCELCIPVSPL
jgi:AraC family transcriptional regulator